MRGLAPGQLALADLTTPGAVARLVGSVVPAGVINCAALADVDSCERQPDLARRINAEVPGELAAACSAVGAWLVHVSTDAVFGDLTEPVVESSEVSPINVYGRTKADGEAAVLEHSANALVVRTNIVGWSPTGTRSLLEYFWNGLSVGTTLRGFSDVWFRPIPVTTLWPLVQSWLEHEQPGVPIRHATGTRLLSKYDFGRCGAEEFGFDPSLVTAASAIEGGLLARRQHRLDVLPSEAGPGFDGARYPREAQAGLSALQDLANSGLRSQLGGFVRASTDEEDG